jgi:predicted nucleic acid-binding protein
MIVIADTTPLNYLILIGEGEVLAQLYGRVIIPTAVRDELTNRLTPAVVRNWIANAPSWLETQAAVMIATDFPPGLGAGEREAISLAQALRADQLIADDMSARREAARRGIAVIGTLGVLREAAFEGLIDLASALDGLRNTSFHITPGLIEYLLKPPR